jgi:hypothetical protein
MQVGGTVVIEAIFAWPDIGFTLLDAINVCTGEFARRPLLSPVESAHSTGIAL